MRIISFSGGRLGAWALDMIQDNDLLIGVDRGALFLIRHGFVPDMALGDFDSVSSEDKALIQEKSKAFLDCDPIHKDMTDTEMALNFAIELKPQEIILLGATGSRCDHTLANIHLLKRALDCQVKCTIIDEHNTIHLVDKELSLQALVDHSISLLPLSMEVRGITLTGFKYPLRDAQLAVGQTLGISNVLTGGTGHISIQDGLLLVIQSKD